MLKTAARTQVSGVLKQMVQGAVKYVAASPEFIWSDSGATTADTLGTVGAIALRGLRAFRFSHTLAFDPSIAGDPVIAAWPACRSTCSASPAALPPINRRN